MRLDPFALPVRYMAADAATDERVRTVELHRDRVILRRRVRGVLVRFAVPVREFIGVTVQLLPGETQASDGVAVVLEHGDPALSVPLYVAPDGDEAVVEWQMWGRILGRPLMVRDLNGGLHHSTSELGGLPVGKPAPRRRRQSVLRTRRPLRPLRRKMGGPIGSMPVLSGWCEIIART